MIVIIFRAAKFYWPFKMFGTLRRGQVPSLLLGAPQRTLVYGESQPNRVLIIIDRQLY